MSGQARSILIQERRGLGDTRDVIWAVEITWGRDEYRWANLRKLRKLRRSKRKVHSAEIAIVL